MARDKRWGWRAPAWGRRACLVALDVFLVGLALFLSFVLRFEGRLSMAVCGVLWRALLLSVGLKIPTFVVFRLYRLSWRFVGLTDAFSMSLACAVGSSLLASIALALRHAGAWGAIPRSVLGIDFALTLLLVTWARVGPRLILHFSRQGRAETRAVRAIIVGAGDAGSQLARALQQSPTPLYRVVGFVDDDPQKRGMVLHGTRVLGPRSQLKGIVEGRSATAVLIAIPAAEPDVVRDTVAKARAAGVTDVKILPFLSELYTGRVTAADLRTLEPADVLRRKEIQIDSSPIRTFLHSRRVLVTGAAGSIGSELCRQVLRFGIEHLTALDFDETGLFYLEAELRRMFPEREIDVVVSDVRDAAGVASVIQRARPHVVYHAAAYKHVPMMERFPAQAVMTNVEGTRNVLDASCAAGCEAFVLISTDKAVSPTSVMGASKRVAEKLISACTSTSTRCVAVRFGNVLGSRGSVLKTFEDQVEHRQAVTVTHPEIKRYFMLTSEAVLLVLQASAVGKAGQVLVLDMGEPVRILDLARSVIRFHGLEPDVDIPVVFTGLRPGEKLFEELLTAEEGTDRTDFERVFIARLGRSDAGSMAEIDDLIRAGRAGNVDEVLHGLKHLVPTYSSPEHGAETPKRVAA